MRVLLVFFLLVFSFSSCTDEAETLFEMDYRVDYNIAAGLNTFETHFFELFNIPTNATNLLQANNLTDGAIEAILPKSARLSSVFLSDDLDFIREISVRLINGDNQNQTEIFFRENIPLDTRDFVDLIPTLPNVKQLMLEDFHNLSIRMEFWEPTPTFLDVKLEFDFQVQ